MIRYFSLMRNNPKWDYKHFTTLGLAVKETPKAFGRAQVYHSPRLPFSLKPVASLNSLPYSLSFSFQLLPLPQLASLIFFSLNADASIKPFSFFFYFFLLAFAKLSLAFRKSQQPKKRKPRS